MVLPAEAIAFIRDEAPLGHVVTVDEDGMPDVTVAWFDVDDLGRLSFATLFDQRKLRNLRRDARIAVSFERDVATESGMRQYLVVEGEARVTAGGAPELLARLAARYVGPDARFPPMDDPPDGFVTIVTPARFRGVGPWHD